MMQQGKSRRNPMFGRSIAVAWVASALVLVGSSAATADPLPNGTPESAITVTDLPYMNDPVLGAEGQVENSAVAAAISAECNTSRPIYSLAWWKVATDEPATFIAQSGGFQGGIQTYAPIGTAVLSGDLTKVLGCGESNFTMTRTAAYQASSGAPLYVATFDTRSASGPPPAVALLRSSGQAPANDSADSAAVVGSIPFEVTQDSTLAADGPLACYSKFGWGPALWYSWTASRSDLIDVTTSGVSIQGMAVIPVVNGERQEAECPGGLRFTAEAGTTYLIGVAGYGDDLRNVGELTVRLSYAPPPPAVVVSVDSAGVVDKKSGVARIQGQVTCTGYGAVSTQTLVGTLSQTHKRVVGNSSFSVPGVSCTGAPVAWMATVQPADLLFGSGRAQVAASVTVCNSRACTVADTSVEVKLKNG